MPIPTYLGISGIQSNEYGGVQGFISPLDMRVYAIGISTEEDDDESPKTFVIEVRYLNLTGATGVSNQDHINKSRMSSFHNATTSSCSVTFPN